MLVSSCHSCVLDDAYVNSGRRKTQAVAVSGKGVEEYVGSGIVGLSGNAKDSRSRVEHGEEAEF